MCALTSAAAQAKIVPGAGIGDVGLGESQAQVHAQLGAPHQLYCWSGRGSGCHWQEANYLQHGSHAGPVEQILFSRSGRVVDMLTGAGNQRTGTGIRVGSTQEAVQRSYRAAACGAGECVLISPHHGTATVTTFFLIGSKVAAIEISRADTVRLTLSASSVSGTSPVTALITVTDPAGDPEIGAVPELTVIAGAGDHVSSITPLGGVETGRYAVTITPSSHHRRVTITATFHWGPPALRRVLGVSASTVLRQL